MDIHWSKSLKHDITQYSTSITTVKVPIQIIFHLKKKHRSVSRITNLSSITHMVTNFLNSLPFFLQVCTTVWASQDLVPYSSVTLISRSSDMYIVPFLSTIIKFAILKTYLNLGAPGQLSQSSI